MKVLCGFGGRAAISKQSPIEDIIARIRSLNIPQRAKAELTLLYTRSQRLAAAIIRFMKAHRRFGEVMLLGCIIAWLLGQVPWIGGFLALGVYNVK